MMEKENLIKLIEKSFRDNFDSSALNDYATTVKYTYGELAKEIEKLHILYDAMGIKPGDKIALVGKNSTRWCIVYLSALTCGATIVPILQDFNSGDISHIINHSESKLLFCSDTIWETLDADGLPGIRASFSLSKLNLQYRREGEKVDFFLSQL
ncbi:MAG: AMP-binding protein, partial [Dysgonamonadaceae bacterium]|nr:AMP-binding protein [Dysgonamonadaceae bacterium]